MIDKQYCLKCQRKNSGSATRCNYCGTPLPGYEPEGFDTEGVQAGPDLLTRSCDEIISQLPEGGLALLIQGAENPIIVQDASSIIVGRSDTDMGKGFVNVLPYGDLAAAVSRQHCRIEYVDGGYTLEDLGSTNGTWLNRRRLTSGVVYPVHSGDQMWFGPLRLTICFYTGDVIMLETPELISISLLPRVTLKAANPQLTPQYLMKQVGPFLQAIAELEQITRACQGLTTKDLKVAAIYQEEGVISVRLAGAAAVIQVIQQIINPWCDKNIKIAASTTTKLTGKLLLDPIQLAEKIVRRLAPDLADNKYAACAPKLLPNLRTLVASPLKLTVPNPLAE